MKKKITKKWIEYSKTDLKAAKVLFDKKLYETCAWHCHQAIEKILKAIIDSENKHIPKIHDLVELLRIAKIQLPGDLMDFIEELNLYYLPPRYPDFYEEMKKIYRPKNMQRILKLTKILFLWLRNYLNHK